EHRIVWQTAAVANRRVSHNWDAWCLRFATANSSIGGFDVGRKERQEAGFNFAVLEIVEDLIGSAVFAVFNSPKFFHIIDIEVRNAPAFYFPGGTKFLECFDRFR